MSICIHCDEVALKALFNEDDSEKKQPFCCYGCLTVFNVLHSKGLESYYEIKKNSTVFKRRSPVEPKEVQFQYLDDPQFLEEYSYLNNVGEKVMEFYLEGIHCLACLWLIEKLPEFIQGIKFSKLSLERSVVTIVLNADGLFSDAARELNTLGYRPHPLKCNQDSTALKIKEERTFLTRIGIAGAAAGNIMIYAVSLYGGASADYAELFNLLTVLFAIPVLTYSAFPIYKNAWLALKNKTVSIDIPISIALIVGGVMGGFNLLSGIPENYFDSLTTLVFLLLLSRYFLSKIQEKGLSAQDLHFFYQSESVLREVKDNHGVFSSIHPRFIMVDDILKIPAGEFIPADGIVIEGFSNINNSLLTGESLPVKTKVGEKVFSGTQNIDRTLVIKVEKIQNETRLGNILKNVENGWGHQSNLANLANSVSKYFTLTVFGLSLVLFLYLSLKGDMSHALEQAITLLIVTCPCALALAIPLTFTRSLSKAAKQGIIIKSDDVLEKLAKVKTVFLDKTGTITHGALEVSGIELFKEPRIPLESILFNLEQHSKHPVGRALFNFVKTSQARILSFADFTETVGLGVSGTIENKFYEIKRNEIFEDGILIGKFTVADTVRGDSREALRNILLHNLKVKLLSGDNLEAVSTIAKEVNLPLEHVMSQLSPEEKSSIIASTPHSMMIGDGANDAMALSQADVGVAVLGAMDISLRAADVYLTTPGLAPVEKLISLAEETMKVVRRNLALSLVYNSLSVTAAFMGFISPLVAAVIMPLSSLTVLISTIIGTKKMRELWK
jgi:heavy metal-(Cd/Co/Hg/Pb/Zn)-translocating P-type ATPase